MTTDAAQHDLSDIGYRIFLDRYAKKDIRRESMLEGSIVLACVDPQRGHREVGRIVERRGDDVVVEFGENGTSRRVNFSYERLDRPIELDPREMHDRVASSVASVEAERDRWARTFRDLLGYFTPAGRILAAVGVEEQLCAVNCFVVPNPSDSLEGIYGRCLDMVKIMRRGGGVGLNLSSLRPRGAYVKTVNGRSSGAVGWSALYSVSTGLIEQGGSRRGAQMAILEIWHPDIEEFIHSKRSARFNNNCNQSVGITDDFMSALDRDGDWSLVFPDTKHPAYEAEWSGDIAAWRGQHPDAVVVYKTMKARDLWRQIIESAHASAEPGLWFKDRCNKAANSYYYPEGVIVAPNPCAEEPLPAWGVCNLGHLQLQRFAVGPIGSAKVDWTKLAWATSSAVRFLDDVIDYTHYYDERTERQQKSERRVGLGTLGLAELMIRCGVRYGAGRESLAFLDELYGFIAQAAYAASADLAREKGSFPKFDADKFVLSGFMQSMPEAMREYVRQHGCRNVTLLTQAPCGTVATMLGTSSGIEPFFDFSWKRNSRVGNFDEHASVVGEWRAQHPAGVTTEEPPLPDYFVTAQEFTPADHAHTQAQIQKWVDAAISKTSNLPADYTVEQVGEYYRLLYDLGCKGGTVYRDGSREEQILERAVERVVQRSSVEEEPSAIVEAVQARLREVVDLPDSMLARKERVRTPMGTLHVTASYLDGEPREAFSQIGKGGSDVYADLEAINRLISLVLRLDSPVPPARRLQLIADNLEGIGGRQQEGFGPNKVLSVPDGLAQALKRLPLHYECEQPARPATPPIEVAAAATTGNGKRSAEHCPKCLGGRLVHQEGCRGGLCQDCGYSAC